eukprot:TRINITY_DN26746_c0_g1_i1.p1 TRINITY_DN26746_c0_g1~~TRINITY_DN26746_c0_g1_i1.p1  ORF type:complete len:362 (-),score=99.42 TRINITY_DN26746_c0_g1_i1:58-1143(-)
MDPKKSKSTKKKSKLNLDSIKLEDVATKRNVMIKFINYLHEHHAIENMKFWLEAQIFKYEKDPQKCKKGAQEIYDKYFGPTGVGINVEEEHLIADLENKVKRPDRTIFMLVQNGIWGLLKLECFPRFKNLEGIEDKINKKKLKSIMKKEGIPEVIQLLDKFLELNTQFPTDESGVFRPTVLPNDAYREHLHTSLPDIDELFKDRDLFLAFREYLYQQLAHENLSFFVEAANFEALKDEEEVKKRATEIFDKFIGPQAEQPINLDFMVVERLKKNLAKPTNQSFKAVTDKIWKVLTNEWFPDFVVSPLYLACNDETIEYVKSDGGKKKSATMDQYQLLCLRMNAERKKGDGEKKGDSEKKED